MWYDADGDGVQDRGEAGIGGVEINITGPDGSPICVTTEEDGSWLATGSAAAESDETPFEVVAYLCDVGPPMQEWYSDGTVLHQRGVVVHSIYTGFAITTRATGHGSQGLAGQAFYWDVQAIPAPPGDPCPNGAQQALFATGVIEDHRGP